MKKSDPLGRNRIHGWAIVVAMAGLPVLADPSPPPVDQPPRPQPAAVADRRLPSVVPESSGLALSPSHPGIIWTHNDSDNPAVVFALDRRGAVAAQVGVRGVPARDWEAIAAWRDARGRAFLAIADIGDNRAERTSVEIDVLAEPALRSASVTPVRRIQLRYPDGLAADAEALLVDPRSSRMYLVTKGLLRSRIFAVPEAAWPADTPDPVVSAELQPLGAVGLQLVTDGSALTSGHVLLRTYGSLMLLAPLDTGVNPLATVALPMQPQGEGLAASGTAIYLSSEGERTDIVRMPVPESFRRELTAPTPAPAAPSAPAGSVAATPDSDPGPGSGLGLGVELGLLGVLLVVLVVVGGLARRLGRSRGD